MAPAPAVAGSKRRQPHKSLRGKRPENKVRKPKAAGTTTAAVMPKNPSHIRNKLKRSEMYGKYLQEKAKQKRDMRLKREKEGGDIGGDDDDDASGDEARPAKKVQKTIDNQRDVDPTMVSYETDKEVVADEAEDEFAPYYASPDAPPGQPQHRKPKILVTTRPRPSHNLFYFIADLQQLIPGLEFYPRKSFTVKQICDFARNRNFTHIIILSQHATAKQCSGMTISHLGATKIDKKTESESDAEPVDESDDAIEDDDEDEINNLAGPTAYFKVSNVVTSQNIPDHGAATSHVPEVNLQGFGTRLGHRIGRMLGSLFPHMETDVRGRQVVSFINQRDYIFIRQHRYVFQKKTEKQLKLLQAQQKKSGQAPSGASTIQERIKTRLQELGPRFTLKLRWLQDGTFDTHFGEYEWIHTEHRKELDTSRRRFHL